jgi:hypothetical protein
LGKAPGRLLGWFVGTTLINFSSMAFLVVGVNLAAFLVFSLLVGTIAKRLIFGETAHADPNGFFLRFYLKRSQAGFEDCAHCTMVKCKRGFIVEPIASLSLTSNRPRRRYRSRYRFAPSSLSPAIFTSQANKLTKPL